MMPTVKLLKECPQYAAILAFWSYREWYENRSISFDLVINSYLSRLNEQSLPVTWTAISKGAPAGMVSLKNDELWSRKDINPWLTSLYVEPYFRHRGIAQMLVDPLIEKARELNFERIFLFLGNKNQEYLEKYYTQRGWYFFEDAVDNDGAATKIFYYTI